MSSESYTDRERRFALGRIATDTRAAQQLEDDRRMRFIVSLDAAIHTAGFKVTDWELQFTTDIVTSPRPFTDPQREVIHDLRREYEARLNKLSQVQANRQERRDAATDTGHNLASPENSISKS